MADNKKHQADEVSNDTQGQTASEGGARKDPRSAGGSPLTSSINSWTASSSAAVSVGGAFSTASTSEPEDKEASETQD
ncbi:hypothetical protein ACFC0S_36170 [Streptomyces sp. NPDC056084]|uniref:hypothetical protein n=1 Tax=unclassified Streptomyces TaxID=2593676 RepID=UPI0035E1E6B8